MGSPFFRPENMVHQTIKTKISSAPSASNSNKAMGSCLPNVVSHYSRPTQRQWRWIGVAIIVGSLAGCAPSRGVLTPQPAVTPVPAPTPPAAEADATPTPPTVPPTAPPTASEPSPAAEVSDTPVTDPVVIAALAWDDTEMLPEPMVRDGSRWLPVKWRQVPAWGSDELEAFWGAWLRRGERPAAALAAACSTIRQLSIGDAAQRYDWIMRAWQPYQVVSTTGAAGGLLTGYFEPMMRATRLKTPENQTPLYAPPAGLRNGDTWFAREQMETDPRALAALEGRELAWVSDPIDALILQIQGSGRVQIQEPDGRIQTARLAFAAHNGHTYQSVARGLLDSGAITEPSWPAIKAWAAANPAEVQRMIWRNPRTVFFREEDLSDMDAKAGPKGAQGVPLTPMRSIAVDRKSIPYGTPVWMTTTGPTLKTARLVMAQDTGGAIVGAVRADFFTGWGDEAAHLAGGLKQPLRLWALWPRR